MKTRYAAIAGPFLAGVSATCAPLPHATHDLHPSAHEPGPAFTPGPAPRARAFDAMSANATCERCHADIAEEWRASLHRRSFVDEVVQSQLEKEPRRFCVACHAPEADPADTIAEPAVHIGVSCVTCHVGETMGVRSYDGREGCGACHEFAFPGEVKTRERGPLMMQTTIAEHAASRFADRSCSSCHMPAVTGPSGRPHKSHVFSASRDEQSLRSAAHIEARIEDGALVVRLEPRDVGHAFPTGDMLRRIAVERSIVDAAGAVVERSTRYLQRHFAFERAEYRPPRRVVSKDDRIGVGPDPTVVRFEQRPVPDGGSLDWEVRYERVADPGGDERPVIVEGTVVLAAGTLKSR